MSGFMIGWVDNATDEDVLASSSFFDNSEHFGHSGIRCSIISFSISFEGTRCWQRKQVAVAKEPWH